VVDPVEVVSGVLVVVAVGVVKGVTELEEVVGRGEVDLHEAHFVDGLVSGVGAEVVEAFHCLVVTH